MSIAGLGLCDWCLYQNAEELLSYAQKQNVRSVQLEVKYPLLPATLFNLSRSIEQYKKSGFTVNALSMNFLNETGIYTATGYAPMLDACSRAMQFAGSHHIKEVIFPFFELNEANTADKVQTMLRFIRDCYKNMQEEKTCIVIENTLNTALNNYILEELKPHNAKILFDLYNCTYFKFDMDFYIQELAGKFSTGIHVKNGEGNNFGCRPVNTAQLEVLKKLSYLENYTLFIENEYSPANDLDLARDIKTISNFFSL